MIKRDSIFQKKMFVFICASGLSRARPRPSRSNFRQMRNAMFDLPIAAPKEGSRQSVKVGSRDRADSSRFLLSDEIRQSPKPKRVR